MKYEFTNRIRGLLFLVLALLVLPQKTLALTISPATVEKEASPGETLKLSVKIFNEGERAEFFYPQTENFRAAAPPAGGGGSPEFLGNTDPFGAANWFQFSKTEEELSPGQAKVIDFRVAVPVQAEPGGHYAALFWSNTAPGQKGVTTVSRVGTLFLFRVKGEIEERGAIKNFSAGPSAGKTLPADFKLAFANHGNVHLRPKGEVKVYNYFGRLVYQTPINVASQAVLPGSERVFTAAWTDRKIYLGPFRAFATLTYGRDQKVLTAQSDFWLGLNYLKWLGVIIAAAVIVLLARRKYG